MDPITLDRGAEDNGLAIMLQGLLSENVAADPAKRSDFEAIHTPFAVIAPDAEVQVTLWFDGGRCTIYDGVRAGVEVRITADSGKIPELSQLKIFYGLPWILDDVGKGFLRSLALREIKIQGLVDLPLPHPFASARRAIDLLRLTRVLSVANAG